jgi:mannose-6-phosphate isomerase-like protein (cupin superfamily)
MGASDGIQILPLDRGPALPLVDGDGSAHAVVWPGMGAQLRSIHRIELGSGARTIEMRHPFEAVYYVIEGAGEAVDLDGDERQQLRPGSMVHVDSGTKYVLSATGEGMSVVGGPSPPDPSLYEGVA